jgi:uncharacterized protein (DUF2236 family)
MAVVAELFGTPRSVIPQTLSEFRDYFASQLAGDTITITPPAKAIAEVILRAPLPAPIRILRPAHRLATVAQLPPRLRHEYELRWTPVHPLLLPIAGRTVKCTTWPVLLAAKRLRPLRPATA